MKCPLSFTNDNPPANCMGLNCAFWDHDANMCAITSIAHSLYLIYDQIQAKFGEVIR